MSFFAYDQSESYFDNQSNKYEHFFAEDSFFDNMPPLKKCQDSFFQDTNMFIDYNQPPTPTTNDKLSDELCDSNYESEPKSQEPLESGDAFNTEAISFATSPRFSGHLENNTNVPRDSEISSFKESEVTDSAYDIVSEILGEPFLQSTNLVHLIEQSVTSENTKLIKLLEKVFRGMTLTQEELGTLNYFERSIVAGVQSKASGAGKKKKREEEKQKLFFKAVLKQTDKDFFKGLLESKKKIKRKQIDRFGYYLHYWGETAKEKGIDIACFFHPNKKIAKGNTNAQTIHTQNPWVKSLNTSFIELILASKSFRKVTSEYLQSSFSQDYLKSRSKKIGKMLNTMQIIAMEAVSNSNNLCENQQQKTVADAIYSYINCNPKCKLPWFNYELKEAMDYASSMIMKQELAQESSEILKKNGCNFIPMF